MLALEGRSLATKRRRGGVKLALVTLALIIFMTPDAPPSHGGGRVKPAKWQQDCGDGHALHRPHQSGGGGTVVVASAAYLDTISQLTSLMSELVNSLLEKVSFLAEIIIESSLEEECESPFAPARDDARDRLSSAADSRESPAGSKISTSACRHYERKYNLTSAGAAHTATSPEVSGGTGGRQKQLERKDFDESEYRNVDALLANYYDMASLATNSSQGPLVVTASSSAAAATAAANKASDAGEVAGAHSPAAQVKGCKLFTFDLSPEDLPANGMAACCQQYHACYATCGRTKLECDRQFQRCSADLCRANFNYKNESLVRAFEAKLSRQQGQQQQQQQAGRRGRRALDSADLSSDGEDDEGEEEDLGYEPIARYDDESALDDELDGELAAAESRRPVRQAPAAGADELGDASRDEAPAGASGPGEEEDEPASARAIKRMRDKYKACKLASKLLIIGNLAFGCQNYKRAQWQACCQAAVVA